MQANIWENYTRGNNRGVRSSFPSITMEDTHRTALWWDGTGLVLKPSYCDFRYGQGFDLASNPIIGISRAKNDITLPECACLL